MEFANAVVGVIVTVLPATTTCVEVTAIVSKTPALFLMRMLPVPFFTGSLNVMLGVAVLAIPVASSSGEKLVTVGGATSGVSVVKFHAALPLIPA